MTNLQEKKNYFFLNSQLNSNRLCKIQYQLVKSNGSNGLAKDWTNLKIFRWFEIPSHLKLLQLQSISKWLSGSYSNRFRKYRLKNHRSVIIQNISSHFFPYNKKTFLRKIRFWSLVNCIRFSGYEKKYFRDIR